MSGGIISLFSREDALTNHLSSVIPNAAIVKRTSVLAPTEGRGGGGESGQSGQTLSPVQEGQRRSVGLAPALNLLLVVCEIEEKTKEGREKRLLLFIGLVFLFLRLYSTIPPLLDSFPSCSLPYLALDDDDSSLCIDTNSSRMLQDVGSELAEELTVLVVHLEKEKSITESIQ